MIIIISKTLDIFENRIGGGVKKLFYRLGAICLIVIIEMRATAEQMEQMLSEHKFYVKVAVDIERRILAGGGDMHYDCEQALLLECSRQQDIWAAGYMPSNRNITYDMVNIKPRQNRSMDCISRRVESKGFRYLQIYLKQQEGSHHRGTPLGAVMNCELKI